VKSRRGLKVRHWSEAEDELLCVATFGPEVLMTDEELGSYIGRTASAIRQRRQRLLRPDCIREAKLRQRNNGGTSPHPEQGKWQAEYYQRGSQNATVIGDEWSQEEDDTIMGADRPCDLVLAERLGRTVKAIHAHRYFLRKKGMICHSRTNRVFA
jgi:hypothetical protein